MDYSTLKKIKRFSELTLADSTNPLHDSNHIERVRNNADLIVKTFAFENNIDINLLHAACYLHDIPVNLQKKYFLGTIGKHIFEIIIIKKHLPFILDKFNLSSYERSVLSESLLNHTFSIPYRQLNKKGIIYTKILQDADSIDYFSYQREKKLKSIRINSPFYFILSLFSPLYFKLGRKIIRYFLNYPKIAYQYH